MFGLGKESIDFLIEILNNDLEVLMQDLIDINLPTVWDLDEFTLSILCGFSPAQVGILMVITHQNWILLTFQMLINLSHSFDDKQAIYGKVQNQYEKTFIRPRPFVKTKQTWTQTSSITELFQLRQLKDQ
ncbi:11059_t:CDS:2 [Scutellospora calospora]|uniref:11059_t:CDS:1 n=1 Tax=Scutellospora calospora TaxID=85575 RepID=A0ACA9KQ46_9GLOM|nr:11059_t:CDS:2 [Scutellospora calospora]